MQLTEDIQMPWSGIRKLKGPELVNIFGKLPRLAVPSLSLLQSSRGCVPVRSPRGVTENLHSWEGPRVGTRFRTFGIGTSV